MSGNSKSRRKSKRSTLKVQRNAELKLVAEQGRAVARAETPNPQTYSANPHPQTFSANPHDRDRFPNGCTMDELFEYMKSEHLKK